METAPDYFHFLPAAVFRAQSRRQSWSVCRSRVASSSVRAQRMISGPKVRHGFSTARAAEIFSRNGPGILRIHANSNPIIFRHLDHAGFGMSQRKYRQPGGKITDEFGGQAEPMARVVFGKRHGRKSPGAVPQRTGELRFRQIAALAHPRRVKPRTISVGMRTENLNGNRL